MDDNVIHIPQEDIEIIDASEYSEDLTEYFNDMPEVARPLVKGAKEAFSKIEQMLYSAPPNGYWTNTYYFSGGFAVKVLL